MTTEQDRAAFEMARRNLLPESDRQKIGDVILRKSPDGKYECGQIIDQEWAWNAALAYAREEQVERERRLVNFVRELSPSQTKIGVGTSSEQYFEHEDGILAAFNEREQGR